MITNFKLFESKKSKKNFEIGEKIFCIDDHIAALIAGEEYTVIDAAQDPSDDNYYAVKVSGKFDLTKKNVRYTMKHWMDSKRFTTDPIVIAEFKRKQAQQRFDL